MSVAEKDTSYISDKWIWTECLNSACRSMRIYFVQYWIFHATKKYQRRRDGWKYTLLWVIAPSLVHWDNVLPRWWNSLLILLIFSSWFLSIISSLCSHHDYCIITCFPRSNIQWSLPRIRLMPDPSSCTNKTWIKLRSCHLIRLWVCQDQIVTLSTFQSEFMVVKGPEEWSHQCFNHIEFFVVATYAILPTYFH